MPSAGHGLQWIWPFLLGYAPRTIAVFDEVCVVHARDELQQALKSSLTAQLQPLSSASRGKIGKQSKQMLQRSIHQGPAPASDMQAALIHTPGLDYMPFDRVAKSAAHNESSALLRRYDYRAELYGVKDQSASVEEYVFHPWYQELLDMGNLQVRTCCCGQH